MTRKHELAIAAAVFFLICLLFFIVFSERGLADLNLLLKESGRLTEETHQLSRENLVLSVEIDRLKNDPAYIESVARKEFGMVGQDELVVKPQRPNKP
jgi:cell division protein FtsB